MPVDVICIILLFYGYDTDEWDKNHVYLMHLRGNTVTKDAGHPSNSYLERVAEYGSHEWKFKIEKLVGKLWIGVWRVNQYYDDEPARRVCGVAFFSGGRGYAFSPSAGVINDIKKPVLSSSRGWKNVETYGRCVTEGETIEMYLDLNSLVLGYKIGAKDYGQSHKIIAGKYRAAVWMSHAGCSITLLNGGCPHDYLCDCRVAEQCVSKSIFF